MTASNINHPLLGSSNVTTCEVPRSRTDRCN